MEGPQRAKNTRMFNGELHNPREGKADGNGLFLEEEEEDLKPNRHSPQTASVS